MFKCTMKTKTHRKPFHLHLEYFFRTRYCVFVMLALLMLAIVKSDGRMLGIMREAYAQGFGVVGAYLREETTRTPITLQIARVQTISGQ